MTDSLSIVQKHPHNSVDAGIAQLGWALVRQIPPVFAERVKQAEAATLRWYQQHDLSTLDQRIMNWEWVCQQSDFTSSPLAFRLDTLNRCAIAYLDRAQWSRRVDDLKRAEAYWQQALELAPQKWPDTARYFHNLGIVTAALYRITGDSTHLTESIDRLQHALDVAVSYESNTALFHESLGNELIKRYERLGTLADLESAILHFERAISLSPVGAPRRARYLGQLGSAYRQRFTRSNLQEDIGRAVELLEDALHETYFEAERPPRLTNYGNALLDRYHLTRDYSDLQLALDVHQRAVDMTAPGDPSLADNLNNLGNSLSEKYAYFQELPDLDHSVEAYRQAVQLTPSTTPHLSSRLYNLGNSLRNRYDQTGEDSDLQQSTQCYRNACTSGLEYSLESTLGASRAWGTWAGQRQAWSEASEAYGYGLEAIDRLYKTQLLRESRELWLKDARELAEHAAYTQARLGNLKDAVVTLELNRTHALSEALTFRSTSLEAATTTDQSAIAAVRQRIQGLEAELHAPESPDTKDYLQIITDLRQARQDMSNIVSRIRNYLPKFMPEGLEFSDIASLARAISQPIIYLVTALYGSVALIVAPAPVSSDSDKMLVHSVWLDRFQISDLNSILFDQNETPRYLHAAVLNEPEALRAVIDDIWPSLDLKLMRPISAVLIELGSQRAMLIPTGMLTLLPLHAAMPSDVTITFIPSARALLSVSQDKDHASLSPSLFAIGNPSSSNRHPLAFAQLEVERVAGLFAEREYKTVTFTEKMATHANVVANIADTTYLHFACHASFNILDPLDSALFLGSDDSLTLREMLDGDLNVASARLVTLSACQTGMTDFSNIPDETVGFPAAFIQASVPGIISTLWPVDDASTAILMVQFYRLHLGGLGPAAALHQAQQWLRVATSDEMNLADYYKRVYMASGRRDRVAYKQMRYHRAHLNEVPFSHPYFWAPFVYSGI